MLAAVQNFIPVVTTEAGLCLTAENWKEAKVNAVSYSIESLLHKPGIALLKSLPDLAHYLGWSGSIILNASMLVANKEGIYTLRSPYDGSKLKLTVIELIDLLLHLKPNAVILPKNCAQDYPQIWDNWVDSITPFLSVSDLQRQDVPRAHGAYFNYTNESVLDELDQWSHLPRYVAGDFEPELIQRLRAKEIEFIETDEPAKAAINGRVYSHSGVVDLTDGITRMQFEVIDSECACPVCAQQFTKAYFHHLLQHTPLLCQRLLIQHNAFWMAESGKLVKNS